MDKISIAINVFGNIAEPEDRLNLNLCLEGNEFLYFNFFFF